MQDGSSTPDARPDQEAEQFDGSRSGPGLQIEAVESFNYVAWQNARPLLRRVTIDNTQGVELASLTLELKAVPPFVRDRRWTIDRIRAGEKLSLREVELEIDPAQLAGLDEAVRGVLAFELRQRERTLQTLNHELRVLARDEWGGFNSMGELLPAFVTPNDPALASLLRSAADVLGQHGHRVGLDGYQSGDPNRAYMLAAALWSAVTSCSLVYANPPGSFEQRGQKIRRVGVVIQDRLATCLDSTLLFAAGLEAIGLNPLLVMTQGHCFTGVWLVEKTAKQLVETDCSELRKAIAAKELVVFETTLVTHRPPARFPDAIAVATAALSEAKEKEFVAAIDVGRARMAQIRPLASHAPRQEGEEVEAESEPIPLPASPGLETKPTMNPEERPRTPGGRIERWQRKLLDLSMRNRLLNFISSKQAVPVVCPNIAALEDRLADGVRMRLIPLTDGNPLGLRDPEVQQQRTNQDLDLEFARQALERGEIACPLERDELDVRLTALFRKVQNDLSEGGSNTLYLAVGFLRWKASPTESRTYRAPLLLVPVQLTRRSASSPFHLTSHEDDVQFNSTLLQLLQKDFHCDLSILESQLPADDRGVDVPAVLNQVRDAVREIPGFEVVEEAAIAPFSFVKYLMWKDLVDRGDQLQRNRVVRHLIQDPDKAFVSGASGPMPQANELDRRYVPSEIVHPLPADSSQLAAVMAAAEGHDLVIVGPPGTGKSQTIANLIAQCLATGKTVLFVAEKTAALDVVYRRLREHGLGDCCVELHSNKAERRHFLDQLEASWKNRTAEDASQWITVCEKLRVRREQLNAYVDVLHESEPNGWTAYRAMGESVRGRHVKTPQLAWPATTRHNLQQYQALERTVSELATTYAAVSTEPRLARLRVLDWSMAWEQALIESCQQLKTAAVSLLSTLESLAKVCGIETLTKVSLSDFDNWYRLALTLSRNALPPVALLLHERLESLQTMLATRGELLREAKQMESTWESSSASLCEALGSAVAEVTQRDGKGVLNRLAEALLQHENVPGELILHPRFDTLRQQLDERVRLLASRTQTSESLQARGFIPTLLERMDVAKFRRDWLAASKSFWPLSAWRRSRLLRYLKAHMSASGVVEPQIDIPLLEEYDDWSYKLNQNLEALGLPASLETVVASTPHALDSQREAAVVVRAALGAAGFAVDRLQPLQEDAWKHVTDSARQLLQAKTNRDTSLHRLQENLAQLELPEELRATVRTDVVTMVAACETAQTIRAYVRSLGGTAEQMATMLRSLVEAQESTRDHLVKEYGQQARTFQTAWHAYQQTAGMTPVSKESVHAVRDAVNQTEQILTQRTSLKKWVGWFAVQVRAEQLGLASFVEALEAGTVATSEVLPRFRLAYARWWLPTVVDRRTPLRTFQRFLHEEAIEDFRRLDDAVRRAASTRARHAISHGLPAADQVPRKSELGVLRHQLGLKRPSKSIRDLIGEMPESFGKLAPCLLMSPLSIAQYLPANQPPFDVVVFDEASQIATWDAIGAIARGKQTIVVGDPKQLPPTNFFGKTEGDDESEELDDYERDLESILDEVKASGLPTLQLNWHYRSRHESLIAFSNLHYYGNELVTFPAAESADRGVSLRHVQDARYDRGKSRTNRKEAEAIVADVVQRMRRELAKPERQRLTFGVVTFNSQQQALIQDLLDEAQRQEQALEWFFSTDQIEPTIVKNLENVQGDERDVMLFSITFGFDAAGKFPIDFGAINRDGGERRLNVAITRARRELVVFVSFLPEQFRAERSAARGIQDLKAFLEYAAKGPQALVGRVQAGAGEHESPLEEAIAGELESRGWRIDPQVGVSGFRIDLGVVHPDWPGTYLAGIECDGATYHRSAVARDRDKTRQLVLENLGWKLIRVWSTDWWYDPQTAIERVDKTLHELLEQSRAEAAKAASSTDTNPAPAPDPATNSGAAVVDETRPVDQTQPATENQQAAKKVFAREHSEANAKPESAANMESAMPSTASEPATPPALQTGGEPLPRQELIARSKVQPERRLYARIDLPAAAANQARFYDDDYAEELRQLAVSIVNSHGPIRDDVLVRELARAHGFARTGSRIKQRVIDLLPQVCHTDEAVGRFLWPASGPQAIVPFRYPVSEEERRMLDEIALPELIGLVRTCPAITDSDDPALVLAREIGLNRLARAARERLESALEASAELA